MNNKLLKALRYEMKVQLGLDWRERSYEHKQVGWWNGLWDRNRPIKCAGFTLGYLPPIKVQTRLDPRCGRAVYLKAKRLLKSTGLLQAVYSGPLEESS